ncbi:hypothetical protein AJ78_04852 [Emergomyces pasteurianus Ep9510]|uniref:Uncharacterized protein n=1 Tax=Emergomyces pasteurianus Ep9510 TaxID=1447872 RepID=A0A1J9PE35_9EURO|nr:hypothetical protein AJ78_04852 [Emergomyces pasteurianus Ep9510]
MAAFSNLTAVLQSNVILRWLRQLPSWRNFAILLILVNLKSLPFAWHARVFFHLFKNLNFHRHTHPKLKEKFKKQTGNVGAHPLFAPVSVMSHTSLMETDYNLHKSNSTYFSDLDISRTALVTNVCTPGLEICRRELDKEVDTSNGGSNGKGKGKKKYPGKLSVLLGSVYCSFKKEIPPYELYEMQSRIAGWDEKWLYVITYFLRPAKRKGERKTVLAAGISQYVIKKGRLTIKPARVLRAGGLIPDPPAGAGASSPLSNGTPNVSSEIPSASSTPPVRGEANNDTGEGLEEGLVREVLALTESSDLNQASLENEKRGSSSSSWDQEEWTWERIEERRLKGLEIVKAFIGLDANILREAEL